MTNEYNNGDWWGWNGGDCPVHPQTEVEGYWRVDGTGPHSGAVYNIGMACGLNFKWEGAMRLRLFRVVKAYREPREFWVNEYPRRVLLIYGTKEDAERLAGPDLIRCIRVREVLE